jgi:hypothetical protein
MGGTMRLGGQECALLPGSLARQIYGAETIMERHRHRYEVNNRYIPHLMDAGMRVSGISANEDLCEMIEVPEHPWFVACQFHPEFTSTPRGRPSVVCRIHPRRPRAWRAEGAKAHPKRRLAGGDFCFAARAHGRLRLENIPDAGLRNRAGTLHDESLCQFQAGLEHPLFVIAGPCVVESRQLRLRYRGHAEGAVCVAAESRSSTSRPTTKPIAAREIRFVGSAWIRFFPSWRGAGSSRCAGA